MANSKPKLAALVLAGCLSLGTNFILPPAASAEDAVADAQQQLVRMQSEARQLTLSLVASEQKLERTQRDLVITKLDLADQKEKVEKMRTQAARVAIAAHQRAETMNIADLLFNSADSDDFLADFSVMHSVSVITDEQLNRLRAEQERLVELETAQSTAIDTINTEISNQVSLKTEYDRLVTGSQRLTAKLSEEQRKDLENRMNDSVRQASELQLQSAIEQSGNRVSRSAQELTAIASPGLWPANGPVTSPFGYRNNPIGGYSELHDGTDIGAPCGAPIRSAWTGVVLNAGVQGGWGNRVIVDSGFYKAAYNHMSSISVTAGQIVQAGDVVGAVGTTGWSTGCHLHFTVWQENKLIDPQSLTWK